ncbi:MAG: GMC family oxidoreductase [Gemmatimonadaceae bacterium]|nr:GMC family oxidoreductase [Gemmatimonadaceae bacterium]
MTQPRVYECDVCIIGSGISAAMVAESLAPTSARVIVIEAGAESPDPAQFPRLRQRFLRYGESPWPRDHIDGLGPPGIQSRSMCVGGLAMHWGGVTPRFSPEDFRTHSLFGVGSDWPITYDDLDPYYQRAEELMGIAGEQGPAALDPRSKPFPLPAIPLTWNLEKLKGWAANAGIPTWSQPSAKLTVARDGRGACCRNDTCFPICPVGAKYSPDMTWRTLRSRRRVELHAMTLVRRLRPAANGARIEAAEAVRRGSGGESAVEYRAKTFVVAAGYIWSAYLLLLSRSGRFPDGLANSSGLVGKYLTGHRNVQAFVSLPMQLYPGINEQHSLVTKHFMRTPRTSKYVRHDLRLWESAVGRAPRLTDDTGALMLGDAVMADWQQRTREGTARVRAYYDVVPDRESALTLDGAKRTPFGDPAPVITMRDDPVSRDLRGFTEEHVRVVFDELARAGNGRVLRSNVDAFQDHPGGGCRMGSDPAHSVVDSWGRTHDHENLFVTGAPTIVSSSSANGTLTFCALSLRTGEAVARGA